MNNRYDRRQLNMSCRLLLCYEYVDQKRQRLHRVLISAVDGRLSTHTARSILDNEGIEISIEVNS